MGALRKRRTEQEETFNGVFILTAPLRKRDKEGSTVITMKRKREDAKRKRNPEREGGGGGHESAEKELVDNNIEVLRQRHTKREETERRQSDAHCGTNQGKRYYPHLSNR
jgi:hypothetical protein